MTVFFTADTQIQHRFTASLRGFDTIAEHDAHIAEVWRSIVTKHDTVWVVGDAHLGNIATAMEFYADLPGRKVLVWGNHDQGHPMHSKAVSQARKYAAGFDDLVTSATFKHDGTYALVSHFPYSGDSKEFERHTQWRLRDEGMPLIHGHVHSKDKVTYSDEGTLQIHVGWDAWGRPISAETVMDMVRGQRD